MSSSVFESLGVSANFVSLGPSLPKRTRPAASKDFIPDNLEHRLLTGRSVISILKAILCTPFRICNHKRSHNVLHPTRTNVQLLPLLRPRRMGNFYGPALVGYLRVKVGKQRCISEFESQGIVGESEGQVTGCSASSLILAGS